MMNTTKQSKPQKYVYKLSLTNLDWFLAVIYVNFTSLHIKYLPTYTIIAPTPIGAHKINFN